MTSSAATQLSWVVDRDCLLQALQCVGNNVLLTDRPELTQANITAPTANQNYEGLVVWGSSGSAGNAQFPQMQLNIPLAAARRIYVTTAQATTVFLWLDDMPAE